MIYDADRTALAQLMKKGSGNQLAATTVAADSIPNAHLKMVAYVIGQE